MEPICYIRISVQIAHLNFPKIYYDQAAHPDYYILIKLSIIYIHPCNWKTKAQTSFVKKADRHLFETWRYLYIWNQLHRTTFVLVLKDLGLFTVCFFSSDEILNWAWLGMLCFICRNTVCRFFCFFKKTMMGKKYLRELGSLANTHLRLNYTYWISDPVLDQIRIQGSYLKRRVILKILFSEYFR